MKSQYQLRKAAGVYWLLDMGQAGYPAYRKPVPLNESAVDLWKLLEECSSLEEVAGRLSREKEIPREVAEEDIKDFVEQLRQRGIDAPCMKSCEG